MPDLSLTLPAAFVLLAVLTTLTYARRRSTRHRRDAIALEEADRSGARIPPSLHPVIDPNICIGSAACVAACPEGDVLGLIGGSGALIRGSACVGHGRCAIECPVDAIRLVIGSSERGVDLPEVSAVYESSRPGVYVIGELGGMGLIKNAMRQGLQAGHHLATHLGRPGSLELDVAVVGAGPAGIACASRLSQAGLRVELLEQNAFGGTIANFPRNKVVMSEPMEIPGFGRFGAKELSKAELVEQLNALREHFGLRVREGVEVQGVSGAEGAFEITTQQGVTSARAVVLAVGRRGTPRALGVPGEQLDMVTYALVDPEQYAGQRVLVVGGGDSAVEAAIDLAHDGVDVSISYRKASFNRCRAKNRKAIQSRLSSGAITPLFETEVASIAPGRVQIRQGEQTSSHAFDRVIICAGGTPPLAFLDAVGVGLRRHSGQESLRNPSAKTEHDDSREQRHQRRFDVGLSVLGVAIVAVLAYLGAPYYLADDIARYDHPMHDAWRPAGDIGHGIGVIATLVMLSNFLYPLRKRWKRLKGLSSINRWLSFHVFVGLLSPTVIAFHAAFQSNNFVATATSVCLAVVVGTGLVGRWAYGLLAHAPAHSPKTDRLRRFMHGWRIFHVSLALLMILVMGTHIGVALYLGYGWILWD